jgi:transposase
VVGVDTHRDTHTAALCDRAGQALAVRQFIAGPGGYAAALAWARQEAGEAGLAWAIEGTRHYGLGLARYLTAAGQRVEEIDSGKHAGRRRSGKSDAIDAVRAAREMLARPGPAQMRADGDREALRLLMRPRQRGRFGQDRPDAAGLAHRDRPRRDARAAAPHRPGPPGHGLRVTGRPARR